MHSSLQLVDYSSTDDEDDDDVDKSEVSTRNKSDFIITRTNLPPLPESFRDIYIVNPRIGDDPALHSGRVRTQPHVKGLWPSHVYLEVGPCRMLYDALQGIVQTLAESTRNTRWNSLLCSEFGSKVPLHISLSAPMMLHTNHRKSFLDQITRVTTREKFTISFENFQIFTNVDDTRAFLVLHVGETSNSNSLSELLELVNSSAIAAGQCSIHETPQAHCSIAWTLLDTGISGSPEIPAIVETHIKASQLSQFEMQVTQVKCKIGKHITTMNLRDKVS